MASSTSLVSGPATVAFNTKSGHWVTRYSFLTNCFAYLNRLLFSGNEQPPAPLGQSRQAGLVFEHNSIDVPRANFYGEQYGTGISVAFNSMPSVNKIYKSFSLEGTRNIADSALNYFIVNSDNTPDKSFDFGAVKDKGGILYGHIGQSQSMLHGGNLELVGVIESAQALPFIAGSTLGTIGLEMTTTENDLLPSHADSLYIIGTVADNSISFDGFLGSISAQINSSFNGVFDDSDLPRIGRNNDNFSVFTNQANQYLKVIELASQPTDEQLEFLAGKLLFEFNPLPVFGDEPRGQYAEAIISLGSAPYELYALNVDFEPTDLDHNGQ